MTPTAELADLVLPAASWAEVDAMPAVPFYAQNVIMAQQKTVQIAECVPDEEMMVEICRRLGTEHGRESPAEIYDYMLGEQLGITWEELKQKGFVQPEFRWRKYEKNGFKTPTGKIELYSTQLESMGLDPLPNFEEPPESPVSTPDLAREYPFVLTTGARIPMFFQSEYRQLPRLRKGRPDPECELHPETAQALGVEEGEWVSIETKRGRCRQKVKIFDGIDPRVVHVQHGWWFPEQVDGPDHGIWESNANALTSMDPPYCSFMGTYQLRALLCRVVKLADAEAPWRPPLAERYETNLGEVQDW
jgi:anaerobic selenocysteine-containing dehydrogenase